MRKSWVSEPPHPVLLPHSASKTRVNALMGEKGRSVAALPEPLASSYASAEQPGRSLMAAEATQTLAQFAASLRYEDIPPRVRDHCKNLLLDALACAVAGRLDGVLAVRSAEPG